jgi:hypothetical protein
MQAVELETTISNQGEIALPAAWRSLFGRHARVILLLDDPPPELPPADRATRQARLREALDALASAGTFGSIDDAVAWQHEVRADRPLPGRED